jgi:hypothetical protein
LLTQGLVGSSAVDEAENNTLSLKKPHAKATVSLTPDAAAKVAQILKTGLVGSSAVDETESKAPGKK